MALPMMRSDRERRVESPGCRRRERCRRFQRAIASLRAANAILRMMQSYSGRRTGEAIRVTVLVRRRPDGPPMPGAEYFLRPPAERTRLSEEEFAARYGASDEDLAKVTAFAETHSLRVVETNAARRTVILSGTVAQMSRAFGVSLGRYEQTVVRSRGEEPQTETYRGRDGAIYIPADLVGIVEGVFGLDNATSRSGTARTRRTRNRLARQR
jgi:Pro-kumamolisin, activation domain